jgi:thiaminase
MKKYEILRMLQTKIIDNVNSYDEYLNATENHGSFTVVAPNLFRAVVMARKMETADYDDAVEVGDSYYPDWLEVWEVSDTGAYTSVRRYVFPMRDMV